jgi:hypothetical protein
MFTKSKFVLLSIILLFISCTDDYSNPKVPFPAPENLKGEKLSATSIKLTWDDKSKGEEGFVVERSILGTTEVVKTTLGANTSEWTDTNVSPVTYKYKVNAFYKQRNSDAISIVYQHIPVSEPSNFTVTINGAKVDLAWNAASGAFDGYKLERKLNNGNFTLLKTLEKTQNSASDDSPVAGSLTYRLYAYQGEFNSAFVDKTITFNAPPQISIANLVTSYLQLTPNYTLTSDGGEPCTVGVCWSKSPNPTINDNKSEWHVKLSSGAKAFSGAKNLEVGATYYLRAYATNSNSTTYSNEVSGVLAVEPQAINLSWTAMTTVNALLPAEVKAYETSSSLNGRAFKAFYVIADMSTGNVELKTVMSSTARKPSAHITNMTSETVYAMTNAGYFGYNGSVAVSYSLVVDRGQKLADNIGALTRGSYSYPLARGAFGVTQNQTPSIKWAVGNFAYDIPSQNVEGETPQPSLSNTFPAPSQNWNPYSAIGGAPVLLKDGKIAFDFSTTLSGKYMTNYELLQTDIFSTSIRPPRTVIGSTADNKIVLFVCDGRQGTYSDGATMLELAQIMKGIGCVNALNLDGGGSSAIIAGGTLLNKPSDGSERAVPSVVAFVKKK